MSNITTSVVEVFDYVWDRFTARLVGLEDEEYFWEPVDGCWSLRPDSTGRWTLDGGGHGGPAPVPVPVTTIAWRVGHLAGPALGGVADRRFGDAPSKAEPGFPARASAVPGFLADNYGRWRSGIAGLTDAEWHGALGASWGPYADATTLDLAFHVLDEVVHHAAEVGVLRDLYPHRSSVRVS
jgi:hypothetical protein